jgi:hypothetical protein
VLRGVDSQGITLDAQEQDGAETTEVTVAFEDIEKARTLFEWGPTTKPGGGSSPSRDRRSRS